nr:uncharacterized mitochondrial protein AtMg00810-like [Tanacetum cinerariifolium]
MVEKSKLDEDLQGNIVDALLYCGMIGSLMYLTSSRPDLIYVVYLCARYQAKPTEKHLIAVKRIIRYLKGTLNMGLWYLKDTAKRKIQLLDPKARYEKHVSENFETFSRENGRVMVFRINCVLQIFGLYTSRLLDAACKKALNLLKKGLLVRGEANTAFKRRLSRRTTGC